MKVSLTGVNCGDGRRRARCILDECDLADRDPEIVHGTPVLKGTRLPADGLVENAEAFMEMDGLTVDQAIAETLICFPGTLGGADTIRALLAYEAAHLPQLAPRK